ncbi:MAG: hypothetical protein MHPSP_002043 [Paramarteilia canceri]
MTICEWCKDHCSPKQLKEDFETLLEKTKRQLKILKGIIANPLVKLGIWILLDNPFGLCGLIALVLSLFSWINLLICNFCTCICCEHGVCDPVDCGNTWFYWIFVLVFMAIRWAYFGNLEYAKASFEDRANHFKESLLTKAQLN